MKTIAIFLLAAGMCFIYSCGKDDPIQITPDPVTLTDTAKIDVLNQYTFDANGGVIILNSYDSQWRAKNFTTAEMNLFSSLDTVDLSAATFPGSVTDVGFEFMYPNPFNSVFQCSKMLAVNFTGQVVFKMVIVDSMLNPLFKANTLLGSNQHISIMPVLEAGKYRLYYTLSSPAHEHFYQSWGNIQKL